MNNKQLKAYIRDKYSLKVKNIHYGYILLEQNCCGLDTYWALYNNKIYMSLSEIIDELAANKLKEA